MGLSEKFVSEMARLVEGEVAAGRAEAVLERHHVEMLNKGMPLEAVALRGLPFAVNIVPLVAGGVLAAPRMPPVLANVRQTQREGWWPPIPPGVQTAGVDEYVGGVFRVRRVGVGARREVRPVAHEHRVEDDAVERTGAAEAVPPAEEAAAERR